MFLAMKLSDKRKIISFKSFPSTQVERELALLSDSQARVTQFVYLSRVHLKLYLNSATNISIRMVKL